MKVNLREIEVGDIFSEESHYVVKEVKSESVVFKHLESGKTVNLSNEYVYNMLNTSDQYEKEVKVTREDKKDGTPGIRTIFEGIRSSEVFTIVFKKQDKAKTKKQFESEKEAQRMEATSMIDKAKRIDLLLLAKLLNCIFYSIVDKLRYGVNVYQPLSCILFSLLNVHIHTPVFAIS